MQSTQDNNQPTRIYIVEDHEVTRLGLKFSLENYAELMIVGMASDGPEAIEGIPEAAPDIVLMDIGLPSLDGIVVTERLKKLLPEIKIIMFSSHDNAADVQAALRTGADAYCLKESSCEQIVSAIESVKAGALWLHPGIARYMLQWAAFSTPTQTDEQSHPDKLSEREIDVLKLVVAGMNNQEIADRMFLSIETVKSHIRRILQKMSVTDRTQAAVKAVKQGLVS